MKGEKKALGKYLLSVEEEYRGAWVESEISENNGGMTVYTYLCNIVYAIISGMNQN